VEADAWLKAKARLSTVRTNGFGRGRQTSTVADRHCILSLDPASGVLYLVPQLSATPWFVSIWALWKGRCR